MALNNWLKRQRDVLLLGGSASAYSTAIYARIRVGKLEAALHCAALVADQQRLSVGGYG
jgi:hypothetical protein